MKRQFILHLDAILVITLLFVVALGMNFIQYRAYHALVNENYGLQMQGLEDSFNLDSSRSYIAQLQQEQADCDRAGPSLAPLGTGLNAPK